MARPRFFTKKMDIPNETQDPQENEEKKEELQAEQEVSNETETTQPEAKSGEKCPFCKGSGLADKETMGNQASQLCKECEGSGQVK